MALALQVVSPDPTLCGLVAVEHCGQFCSVHFMDRDTYNRQASSRPLGLPDGRESMVGENDRLCRAHERSVSPIGSFLNLIEKPVYPPLHTLTRHSGGILSQQSGS